MSRTPRTSIASQDESNGNDNSNGIEIFLRIRPSNNPSGYISMDDINENVCNFQLPSHKSTGDKHDRYSSIVDNSKTRHAFSFNQILDETSTQDQVFSCIGVPTVQNVLNGYNSTVFAYGQTGSGKTFTITGGPEKYSDRGIIPRAISMLFSEMASKQQSNVSYSCYISYLELYNERGYDLLSGEFSDDVRFDDMPRVTMLEDEDGNYHFRNLSVHQVANEEDALNLLFVGDTNRAIGETEMNQSSSRSHCIFTIMVEKRNIGQDTVIRSKLNLVDLAGSERVHKTNSVGKTLKEAQYINVSLFYLEMVIVALHDRSVKGKDQTHVPYRNSMMTSVLRDSLGGNCKTIMVATISAEAAQTEESISTCSFAQRVALVKNNATINEELEPELIIARLKGEVKRLRDEVRYLKGENREEDLDEDTKINLETAIQDYVVSNNDNSELNVGALTLTKIKATFSIFKKVCLSQLSSVTNPTNNTGEEVAIKEKDSTSSREVALLNKKLKQREHEIKILVDMVKKGSNAGDLNTRFPHLSVENNEQQTNYSESKGLHKTPIHQVYGVERCYDTHILSDPPTAFAWFRERYPGLKAINENKEVLQKRYHEAKEEGRKVKEARDTINHHKHLIEEMRREQMIANLHSSCSTEQTPTRSEETEHCNVIDSEKKVYQSAFQRLRELKSTIEHIKCLMERSIAKLQKEFDAWYQHCVDSMEGNKNVARFEEQDSSLYIVQSMPQITQEQIEFSSTSNHTKPSIISQNQLTNHKCTVEGERRETTRCTNNENSFQLPVGVHLTGDSETDEDIIAFYKAKEAFLSHSKQSHR